LVQEWEIKLRELSLHRWKNEKSSMSFKKITPKIIWSLLWIRINFQELYFHIFFANVVLQIHSSCKYLGLYNT
jgi:hypothetical protein